MNKTQIINKLVRKMSMTKLKVKKHSPEILIGVGVVGIVSSGVMACKATLKVNDILEDTKESVKVIHDVVENPEKYEGEYTEEDSKKDLTTVYVQTGVKLVKLYAPAVILGAFSIGCVVTSHSIMRKRNVALAAAYATVDKGFKEYRGRVIERFGKELDHELKYNIKAKEIEETVVDEDGNETVVKTIVETADPNQYSDYARVFDEACNGWTKDAEFNFMFLRSQQNYANQKLKSKGHLFLNEVYEMLGIPKTKAGHVVGWIYDESKPIGDNYIDFGLYDINNERVRRFINGDERNIILDFNVDGNIWDLM